MKPSAQRFVTAAFVVAIVAFLYLPAVVMVLFAFEPSQRMGWPMTGFSLRWFEETLGSADFARALGNTSLVAIGSGILATGLGTAAAFGIQHLRPTWRQTSNMIVMLPATFPGLLLGVALLILFRQIGLPRGLPTLVLSHAILIVPFVVATVSAQLEQFDFSLLEAARTLGASSFQAGLDVIVPLVKTAVVGSFFLAAALSVEEFVVTFFVMGDNTTVPVLIWGMMRLGVGPAINALATLVLVVTVGLAVAANRVTRVQM
jgi:spermidine/putrescine transport system permease protein